MAIRGAEAQNDYFVRQRVEVRNTHNGRETWRGARIHQRSSRGCFVIYLEGPQTPQHIMFPDLRPMEATPRERTPKVTTPLMTAADIEAYNTKLEAEAKRAIVEASKPPQTLVLVRRMPEAITDARRSPSGRRVRKPKEHKPTPLSIAIRNGRAGKSLQQVTLAELSKIRQPRLSQLESGDVRPTDEELLELAVALDLEYDELVALRALPPVAAAARPEPELAPEPEPEPATHVKILERLPLHAPTLREDILEPRKPVELPQQRTVDVERLLRENAMLIEDNHTLRRAVVFYAGLER